MFIKSLTLENFRNHENFSLRPSKETILVCGPNGIGKTSILEAISMLSPGKGLLGAEIVEQNRSNWMSDVATSVVAESAMAGASAVLDDTIGSVGPVPVGSLGRCFAAKNSVPYKINAMLDDAIKVDVEIRKRGAGFEKVVSIGDKRLKTQAELLQWCDVIWFSGKQQYDLDRSQARRALIDRLAFHCNHNHAEEVKKYDILVKQRLALLKAGSYDPRFVDAIELQIAQASLLVARNRVSLLESLNKLSAKEIADGAKKQSAIIFVVDGPVETMVSSGAGDDEVVSFVRGELLARRVKDGIVEQTTFGVHKSKIEFNNSFGVSCSALSSGQQKLMFLFMIRIFCETMNLVKGRKPIVLLDEILSLLDEKNVEATIDDLQQMSAQIWMTSPTVPSGLASFVQVLRLPLD